MHRSCLVGTGLLKCLQTALPPTCLRGLNRWGKSFNRLSFREADRSGTTVGRSHYRALYVRVVPPPRYGDLISTKRSVLCNNARQAVVLNLRAGAPNYLFEHNVAALAAVANGAFD